MALADDFATLTLLGEAQDAYTFGTPANLALRSQSALIEAEISAGLAQAEAGVAAYPIVDPYSVAVAVQNAAYMAQARASLAWLARVAVYSDGP